MERLSDIGPFSGYFLSGHIEVDADLYLSKKLSPEEVKKCLVWGMWRLEENLWTTEAIETGLRACATELDVKLRNFLSPFYPATTGRKSATPLFDTLQILGRDLVRARLRDAIQVLGGLSKKGEGRWKKEYDLLKKQAQEIDS
jgi:glutamyl-tRNA synthetase